MTFKSVLLKKTFLLTLYIVFNISIAQSQSCNFTEVLQIEAQSGMRIREQPDLNSKPIAGVPYKAVIEACQETFGSARIEGIDGHWRFVRFKNKSGYMWDGYAVVVSSQSTKSISVVSQIQHSPQTATADDLLEEIVSTKPPGKADWPFSEVRLITESYPYCRDITTIDRSLFYYSVYLEDDYYVIRPAELSIELKKNSPKNVLHFNIKPAEGDGSLFIIGLKVPVKNWKKIRNNDFLLTQLNRTLTPGIRLDLYPYEPGDSYGNIKLIASGTVKSYQSDCPVVENYSLMVEMMLDKKEFFDLTDQLIHRGKCGVPDIFWFGDLNQDGYTDLILVGEYPEYTAFTLFMSQPESALKYKKMSEWIVEDCD